MDAKATMATVVTTVHWPSFRLPTICQQTMRFE